MYPVDLPSVDERELTKACVKYLLCLQTGAVCNEWFQSSTNAKVAIQSSNVTQLQLFEDQPDCMLLVLHLPDQPKQVVALYLHEKWWHVDDILKTCNKTRNGLEMVQSIMERVLVLVLSQLVDRCLGEELLFSHHPQTENCKLLWSHGTAVGFYSFKPKGSLCVNCISQCYELPVLDTIFVRSHCRRRGFGLLMLEDFCNMFPNEQVLGISSPLSTSMVAVYKKFLLQHTEIRDVLYEVEAPGGWAQRRNIWLNIQLGHYSHDTSSTTAEQTAKNEGSSSCLEKQHCNPIKEAQSLNSGFSQTRSPAHMSDPNWGTPIATVESPNTKQALKCKVRLSVDPDRKELEKAKRGRRT